LKQLQYGWLSPQGIGGEGKLMVDKVKYIHPCEPGLVIIDDLREISIVNVQLLNLDINLSL